jgi:protein involved in polysaccharide export with SLBB domain
VSTDLKQFGYGFFKKPSSTFDLQVPVSPDYVIGPGDEIRIAVWGTIEGQWTVAVDRDGNIAIPNLGILGVTGLKFEELREILHKEFSRYYTGFEMNVSMGALRTMRVYVVGNAEKPGSYIISSLSTLINALFETSSPSKVGTLRDIQVKRNGDTLVHFDLYDFLLKGDKTKDVRLMPEDVILIPPVGPLVGIAGSVNNPAIYELKGETIVSQLIEMAGGLNDIASKGRVQIDHIVDNNRQIVFESDLAEAQEIEVQGGDIVKIFPVIQDKRLVRITGAVLREGDYGFQPGMTVKDLISRAGGLKYYAHNKEAELTRMHLTDKGDLVETIVISLDKAMEGDPENNIALKVDDHIFVHIKPEWELFDTVTISGEVKFPGTYNIERGETLSSLIERAGGFTDRAYLNGAVFTREMVRRLQQEQIDEMILRLERELLGAGVTTVATAYSAEEMQIRALEMEQKMQFIEALRATRANGRMVIKLDDPERLKDTPFNIELEEGDNLVIPSDPQVVQVIGSVNNQVAFIYDKKLGVKKYIDLAGGYTKNADKKRIYVLKVDGTAVQTKKGMMWNKDSMRWEQGKRQLESGDTIIVPEKLDRVAWMREIKDITQILFQIAVTTGVVIALF